MCGVAAARYALPATSETAFLRSAFSDRDENCATTIAVDVAATTAKAAPSHQRTPMKRRVMPYTLDRERAKGLDRVREFAARVHGAEPTCERAARAGAADDELEAGRRFRLDHLFLQRRAVRLHRNAEADHVRRELLRKRERVTDRRVGAEVDDLPAVS